MSAPVALQIFVGFLLFSTVFIPVERCFPLRQQDVFRRGWKTDAAYYVIGCFVARLSDASSVGAMLLIRRASGVDLGDVAAFQPAWLQVLEILIIADFLAYVFHRALHRYAWLWPLHRVHHSSEHMDWLTNIRLHPLDKLLGDCFQFIPIFCLGFSDGAVLAYTLFLAFQGFTNHSNIKLHLGPLRWILASPQFHHWHHCDDPKAYNKNFAPHLVIFDWLFGTLLLPPDRSFPSKYGVSEYVPETFVDQIIGPFGAGRDRRGCSTGRATPGLSS